MKALLKRLVQALGFEVRRIPGQELPALHDCSFDGRTFPFWIANEHTASWWLGKPVRFDAEMKFLKQVAMPGSLVLEVGAHHGMHTLQLAHWIGPQGVVHALEMNAQNALVLCANVGVSGSSNIRVQHLAAASSQVPVQSAGEQVTDRGRSVPATTLDELCRAHAVSRVDVLKIDVEGFEGHVLRGAQQVLATAPHIDLELHCDELWRFGDTVDSVLDLLPRNRHTLQYMRRPDWESAFTPRHYSEIPRTGVVNLFMRSNAPALPQRPAGPQKP